MCNKISPWAKIKHKTEILNSQYPHLGTHFLSLILFLSPILTQTQAP